MDLSLSDEQKLIVRAASARTTVGLLDDLDRRKAFRRSAGRPSATPAWPARPYRRRHGGSGLGMLDLA